MGIFQSKLYNSCNSRTFSIENGNQPKDLPDGSYWLFCNLRLCRIFIDTINIVSIGFLQTISHLFKKSNEFFAGVPSFSCQRESDSNARCDATVQSRKSSYKNKKFTVNFNGRFRPIFFSKVMEIFFVKIVIRKKILITVALLNIITGWKYKKSRTKFICTNHIQKPS